MDRSPLEIAENLDRLLARQDENMRVFDAALDRLFSVTSVHPEPRPDIKERVDAAVKRFHEFCEKDRGLTYTTEAEVRRKHEEGEL